MSGFETGLLRCLSAIAISFGLCVSTVAARSAETWPAKEITFVGIGAGGPIDALQRLIASELSARIGKPVIVDNRPGAGGNIAAAAVARAQPDGYTFLFASNGTAANNKLLFKSLPFDPQVDLVPVAKIAESQLIFIGNPRAGAKDIHDLIRLAREKPGQVNFGHPGPGLLGHITALLLEKRAGITLNLVPYRGAAPLTTDVLAGQIDFGCVNMGGQEQALIADGKLNGLAITARTRLAALPDVPTMAEVTAGFEATAWYALMGPKDLPAEIVARVNAAVNAYLATPDAKAKLAALTMTPSTDTPDGLKSFITEEITKWRPVIEEAKLSLD